MQWLFILFHFLSFFSPFFSPFHFPVLKNETNWKWKCKNIFWLRLVNESNSGCCSHLHWWNLFTQKIFENEIQNPLAKITLKRWKKTLVLIPRLSFFGRFGVVTCCFWLLIRNMLKSYFHAFASWTINFWHLILFNAVWII